MCLSPNPITNSFRAFMNGQGLILGRKMGDMITDGLHQIDSFEWGIVPYPKWDEHQEEYRTNLCNGYMLYCIPNDVKDSSMSGAVLEAMASDAIRRITPVYYETAIKIKYASDQTMQSLYDLIRSNIDFNFGLMYCDIFSGTTPYRDYAATIWSKANNPNWNTAYAENESKYNEELTAIVNALKELP